MNAQQNSTPSRSDLTATAHELGRLLASVGDFYDVVESITAGWAEGVQENLPGDTNEPVRWQLAAAHELESVAGNSVRSLVDDARDAGLSWSKIGDALDTSRQAAQQRYGSGA